MTATQAQGRSSARRGQEWQRECAATARLWFPAADHVGRFPALGQGDITGVGDRIIECTVQPMDNLAVKLRQAEADAVRAEFAEFYVVKKAPGEGPGRAYAVTRVAALWPLLARLDRLEGMLDEAYAELETRR